VQSAEKSGPRQRERRRRRSRRHAAVDAAAHFAHRVHPLQLRLLSACRCCAPVAPPVLASSSWSSDPVDRRLSLRRCASSAAQRRAAQQRIASTVAAAAARTSHPSTHTSSSHCRQTAGCDCGSPGEGGRGRGDARQEKRRKGRRKKGARAGRKLATASQKRGKRKATQHAQAERGD
jgi:hypothetical protein